MSCCNCLKAFGTTIYVVLLLYITIITFFMKNKNNECDLINLNIYTLFNTLLVLIIFIINHIHFDENKYININKKFKYKLIFLLISYIFNFLISYELYNYKYGDKILDNCDNIYKYSTYATIIISTLPQEIIFFFSMMYLINTIYLALSYFFRLCSMYVLHSFGFVYYTDINVISQLQNITTDNDDDEMIPV